MTTLDAKFAAMVAKYNGLTAAQVIDYLATAVEQDAALDSIQAADDHMQDMAIALRALVLPPQPVEVTEAARAVLRAYDEWSGAEPSTSALERAIDRDLRAAVDAILEARITATRPSGDGIQPEPGTILICPERDARCPHGIDCPYSIDRYSCDMEASRRALIVPQEAVK